MNRATRNRRGVSIVLWGCVALFGARVIGQVEALLLAPQWLPPMDAWYSGLLPYYLLLPAQIALLMLMSVMAWNPRVSSGQFAAENPRVARMLRIAAYVYLAAMAARLGLNVSANGAEFWRSGAIPVAFHWVLALFLLVSARAAELPVESLRIPSGDEQQDEEADDIAHGDIPALPQPLAHGLGFGEEVGHRYAGRRTEPGHRSAEPDRERQRGPVVAALLKSEPGQRNVVEHRGDDAQSESGLRRSRRQGVHRHH
jgi:hypothetical protein